MLSTDHLRLAELADRILAPGHKACAVTASECHEIAEGVHALIRELSTTEVARRDVIAISELRMFEIDRLTALINMPRTDEWFESVRIEAAHQIERWGVEHDAGKRTEDWVTLLIYLLGKAAKAYWSGDRAKLEHHVITTGAVALNWWRNLTGVSTAMRPGIADPVVSNGDVAP